MKVKDLGVATTPRRALLELVEISMLKMIHVLHTMPAEEKVLLKKKLLEEQPEPEAPEEAARALLFCAEISRLQGDTEEARRLASQALQLLPKLSPRGAQNGTAPALHLMLALLGVEGHLASLDKCPKCCRAYDEAIKFKRLGLERKLADAESTGPLERSTSETQADTPSETHEEGEDEEFFSAEEEQEGEAPPPPAKAFWKWSFRRPPSIETDCSEVSPPSVNSPSLSFSWASEVAVKALKDLAKKSAVAGGQLSHQAGQLSHQASEQLGHLANSAGKALSRKGSSCGSSKLHLEALLRQADQGDCSVVCMPTPGAGVSEAEVVAYLRWAAGLVMDFKDADDDLAKMVDQSKVVALYDFDPTKIDWPFNRQKPLALSTGQVVKIVYDDGSEWALGHLSGVPATLGYFPKNYTVSVGEYQELLRDFENEGNAMIPEKIIALGNA
ncbi:unnamed protein product [Effrenium voratum]|nr:unnamed protein product [Effrenium voratum]